MNERETLVLLFGAGLVWFMTKQKSPTTTPPAPAPGGQGNTTPPAATWTGTYTAPDGSTGGGTPPPPPPPGGGVTPAGGPIIPQNPTDPLPPWHLGPGGLLTQTLDQVDMAIIALLQSMPVAQPNPHGGFLVQPPYLYAVGDPSDPRVAPLGMRQATQDQAEQLNHLLALQSPLEPVGGYR